MSYEVFINGRKFSEVTDVHYATHANAVEALQATFRDLAFTKVSVNPDGTVRSDEADRIEATVNATLDRWQRQPRLRFCINRAAPWWDGTCEFVWRLDGELTHDEAKVIEYLMGL